ncbi:hypothetical protein [Aeromonas sp. HMWF016]|uniref:hypothetical protein n=1 Tax=Aeromonas sp. HMWF016 TaxID=2056852 RepID=UPI0015E7EDD9|nr:hypothetical protein [Aeromonas sp. HMWF016]
MNILLILKRTALIILCLAISVGGVILRMQYKSLLSKQAENERLTLIVDSLQARLAKISSHLDHISTTLSKQQLQQQQLEENSEQTRQQIRKMVAQIPCANELVPDNIIRLQRNALTGHSVSG